MKTSKENPWRRFNQPQYYSIMILFLSMIALGVVSIQYSNAKAQETERKFCALMETMNAAYGQTPPRTPTGQKMANDIAKLTEALNCKP